MDDAIRVGHASERWASLAEFVGVWYRVPLEPTGNSEDEIQGAEVRLGRGLPKALREWYGLVGNRLVHTVQDRTFSLDELRIRDGGLTVWIENQGVWSIDVPIPDDGSEFDEDPLVAIDDSGSGLPGRDRNDRLSRALTGMVVSETLVDSAIGEGSLGSLWPEVRGGWLELEDATRIERWPALDYWQNPFFETSDLRGHRDLVLRRNVDWVHWMTATPEAYAEACLGLGLDLNEAGAS